MTPLATAYGEGGATLAALEPLDPVVRRWPQWLGVVLTAAMIGGLGWQLFHRGLGELGRSVPGNPLFFAFFLAHFMTLPVFDYLIFRHLWKIPIGGLAALIRKRIANDVLVTYSGEAYFYSWARANATLAAAPFGAIKDVSILSAVAGNALTLTTVAAALPLARGVLTPEQFRAGLWSAGLLVAMSLPFLLFSRRVFSLPRRDLWTVFGLHCVRVVVSSSLVALAWHLALPQVSYATWLFLAAARMLVSRLPLIPNKELLFFTVASALIGGREPLVALLAFCAALTLVINAVLVVGFAGHGLASRGRPW